MPPPIDPGEVVAGSGDPVFVTFINPSIEKGMLFYVRLAEELSRQRPDIPMLVIEGRGSSKELVAAGLRAGFDLRRHENMFFAPATAFPREIYEQTRILLVPSIIESAGRVVCEAMLNGIPFIHSGRGGLAETADQAGLELALPASLTLTTRETVNAAEVWSWLEVIQNLWDHEEVYLQASARAAAGGQRFRRRSRPEHYIAFLERIACKPTPFRFYY